MLEELSKIATRYGFIHQGRLIKEITLEELELDTKASIKLKVSEKDLEKTLELLKKEKVTLKVEKDIINIYDRQIPEIVILLYNNKIDIKDINRDALGIENYYLSLIGGFHG